VSSVRSIVVSDERGRGLISCDNGGARRPSRGRKYPEGPGRGLEAAAAEGLKGPAAWVLSGLAVGNRLPGFLALSRGDRDGVGRTVTLPVDLFLGLLP
jgi:hypothetical protein